MQHFKVLAPLVLVITLVLGGCASTDKASDTQTAASTSVTHKASKRKRAANAAAVATYKQQVAKRIYARNNQTFEGKLPPLLKSVVVLNVTVDESGKPIDVSVRRSNGFKKLERTAVNSVRKAGPYPRPSAKILAGERSFSYMETWLFRDDGKFQIRSLAEAQMGPEGVVARR